MKPFEHVVTEHGETILRVCTAILGPVDAEDAWSETFLAALRAYPALPPGSNVEAWLVTIAHRKALDAVRARNRRPVAVADVPEPAGRQRDPADEHDDQLRAALQALPLKQRQAVAYHHLAGLPYAEVAQLIGGSADAARRASADGIAALRKTYQQGGTS